MAIALFQRFGITGTVTETAPIDSLQVLSLALAGES
jgi:hypothetical protein